MIRNLFSVFDPCTGKISLNWIRSLIFIFILPYKFWLTHNKIYFTFKITLNNLNQEIKRLISYKGSTLIFLSIFILILINNLIGLLPYVFTSSSHLVFSLRLALPLWISLMLYGWLNKTNRIFSHLVPRGTPNVLIPFMVIIETIRNLIRPGSLAVRLTANIIAGHLLISLLGNNTNSSILIISTIIIFLILIIFELAVGIIQSYVFITLITLYSREV